MSTSLQLGISNTLATELTNKKTSNTASLLASSNTSTTNKDQTTQQNSAVAQDFARQLDQQIEQSQQQKNGKITVNGNPLPLPPVTTGENLSAITNSNAGKQTQTETISIEQQLDSILNQDTNPQSTNPQALGQNGVSSILIEEFSAVVPNNPSISSLTTDKSDQGIMPVVLPSINPNIQPITISPTIPPPATPPVISPKPIQTTSDSLLGQGGNDLANNLITNSDNINQVGVDRLPPETTFGGNLLANYQQNQQNPQQGNSLPAMELPGIKTNRQNGSIILDPAIQINSINPPIAAKEPNIVAPYVLPRESSVLDNVMPLPNIKTTLEKGFERPLPEFSFNGQKESGTQQFLSDSEQKLTIDDLKGNKYLSENKLLANNLKTSEQINALQNSIGLKESSALMNKLASSLAVNDAVVNPPALLEPVPANVTQSASVSVSSMLPSASTVSPATNLLSPFSQGLQLKNQFTPNLVARIQWIQQQAMSSAEILMDPPELGPLSVKLTNHNGETQIQFQVNNAQTKELIEDNLSKLKELLSEQGISLGDTQVEQQNERSKDNNRPSQLANTGSLENDDDVTNSTHQVVQQGLLDTYI